MESVRISLFEVYPSWCWIQVWSYLWLEACHNEYYVQTTVACTTGFHFFFLTPPPPPPKLLQMVYQTMPLIPAPDAYLQQVVHSEWASYSPPSMQRWAEQQKLNSTAEITAEWQHQQFSVHKDQQEYPLNFQDKWLHPHFCLQKAGHQLIYSESINDIKDAVCTFNLSSIILLTCFLGHSNGSCWGRTTH